MLLSHGDLSFKSWGVEEALRFLGFNTGRSRKFRLDRQSSSCEYEKQREISIGTAFVYINYIMYNICIKYASYTLQSSTWSTNEYRSRVPITNSKKSDGFDSVHIGDTAGFFEGGIDYDCFADEERVNWFESGRVEIPQSLHWEQM